MSLASLMPDFLLKKLGNIVKFKQLNSSVSNWAPPISLQSEILVHKSWGTRLLATWYIYPCYSCIAENRKYLIRISILPETCNDFHLTLQALEQLCWSYRKLLLTLKLSRQKVGPFAGQFSMSYLTSVIRCNQYCIQHATTLCTQPALCGFTIQAQLLGYTTVCIL